MFPIPFNFPFRKKDGSVTTIDAAISSGGTPYTLPTASAETKGGVKIGSGLSMSGETLNNSNPTPYSLPTASASVKGGVKIGDGLTMDGEVLKTTGSSGGGFTLLKKVNSTDDDKTVILPANVNTLYFCFKRNDSKAEHIENVVSYADFEEITDAANYHGYGLGVQVYVVNSESGSIVLDSYPIGAGMIYDKTTRTITITQMKQSSTAVAWVCDVYIM